MIPLRYCSTKGLFFAKSITVLELLDLEADYSLNLTYILLLFCGEMQIASRLNASESPLER